MLVQSLLCEICLLADSFYSAPQYSIELESTQSGTVRETVFGDTSFEHQNGGFQLAI